MAIELLDAVSNLGRLSLGHLRQISLSALCSDGEASAAAPSATLVREGAACLAEAAALS